MKIEEIDTKMLKVLLFITVCVFVITFIVVSAIIIRYYQEQMTELPDIFHKIKEFIKNI